MAITKRKALKQFDELQADCPESIEKASMRVTSLIKWSDMISDSEYTAVERVALLRAYRDFYGLVKPIISRHIDGDE
jgi:hypothetical protein